MKETLALAAAILTAISTSPLYGQNGSSTLPSTKPDCAPGGVTTPRSDEPTESPRLGNRLSQSKGVICPPKDVDPGIVSSPPPANAPMPVIPPPGTPGGDPATQPK
jgi:hypothetical protein